MASPWGRVRFQGYWLTRRDRALLLDAAKAAGFPLRMLQGSWSQYRLSAGTHGGAGAFDLSVYGVSEATALRMVHELRKRNVAAYLRSPRFGWTASVPHIHGIVKDTPGLASGAKQQVYAYNAGRNALANGARDPHPRPTQRRFYMKGQAGAPRMDRGAYVRLSNLRYGKSNADVKDLQRALKIAADGEYGRVTDRAVRRHQKRMGWKPDRRRRSYVGPKQAAALGLRF